MSGWMIVWVHRSVMSIAWFLVSSANASVRLVSICDLCRCISQLSQIEKVLSSFVYYSRPTLLACLWPTPYADKNSLWHKSVLYTKKEHICSLYYYYIYIYRKTYYASNLMLQFKSLSVVRGSSRSSFIGQLCRDKGVKASRLLRCEATVLVFHMEDLLLPGPRRFQSLSQAACFTCSPIQPLQPHAVLLLK